MTEKPIISVVSPVYRGERMLSELVRRTVAAVSGITDAFEIILVNDASPDGSWREIVEQCSKDSRVKGIDLSRNFGQHYAISAGLSYVTGEWVVVMDCDLQDRPEEIPRLYAKAQEGYDIVYARRVLRKDILSKKLSSWLFHKVYDGLSGHKSDVAVSNFGIYSTKVIEQFNRMPERARSFTTMLSYLGFSKAFVDVQHDSRAEGRSGYTFAKRFHLAMNILVSQSNRPLKLAVSVGFVMSLIAFLLAIYNLIAKWVGIITLSGFTTTVFSIWFVGGMLMMMLGVVGLYVGEIFEQVKGRPLFVVKDKVNFE